MTIKRSLIVTVRTLTINLYSLDMNVWARHLLSIDSLTTCSMTTNNPRRQFKSSVKYAKQKIPVSGRSCTFGTHSGRRSSKHWRHSFSGRRLVPSWYMIVLISIVSMKLKVGSSNYQTAQSPVLQLCFWVINVTCPIVKYPTTQPWNMHAVEISVSWRFRPRQAPISKIPFIA